MLEWYALSPNQKLYRRKRTSRQRRQHFNHFDYLRQGKPFLTSPLESKFLEIVGQLGIGALSTAGRGGEKSCLEQY
jgi:hypothetical protein